MRKISEAMSNLPTKSTWLLSLGFVFILQPCFTHQGLSMKLQETELDSAAEFTENEEVGREGPAFQPDETAAAPRIIYGQGVTNDSAYPWAVSIKTAQSDYSIVKCGGSIIAPTYVLTTALCVSENVSFATNDPGGVATTFFMKAGGIRVHDGTYGGAADPNVFSRQSTVRRFALRHSNFAVFAPHWTENDIALIRTFAWTFNEYIQAVQLPNPATNYAGSDVRTVGWGMNETSNEVDDQREAFMKIESDAACSSAWNCGTLSAIYKPASMYCYGGQAGAVCKGDEGSGVVTKQLQGGVYVDVLVSMNSFYLRTTDSLGGSCTRRMKSFKQDNQGSDRQGRQSGWLSNLMRQLSNLRQKKKDQGAGTTVGSGGTASPGTTATPTTFTTPTPTTTVPNNSPCHADHPSVGVRISNYLSWITTAQATLDTVT